MTDPTENAKGQGPSFRHDPQLFEKGDTLSFDPQYFVIKSNVVVQISRLHYYSIIENPQHKAREQIIKIEIITMGIVRVLQKKQVLQ